MKLTVRPIAERESPTSSGKTPRLLGQLGVTKKPCMKLTVHPLIKRRTPY